MEVNNRVNYPLKSILNDLVSKGYIDMSNQVTKFCVSWVTCGVSNYGLGKFIDAWNKHPIPSEYSMYWVYYVSILLCTLMSANFMRMLIAIISNRKNFRPLSTEIDKL